MKLFSVNIEEFGRVARDQPMTIFRYRLIECVGAVHPDFYDKVRGAMRLVFELGE